MPASLAAGWETIISNAFILAAWRSVNRSRWQAVGMHRKRPPVTAWQSGVWWKILKAELRLVEYVEALVWYYEFNLVFVFVWQANVTKNELDCHNGNVDTLQIYPQNLNLAGLRHVFLLSPALHMYVFSYNRCKKYWIHFWRTLANIHMFCSVLCTWNPLNSADYYIRYIQLAILY